MKITNFVIHLTMLIHKFRAVPVSDMLLTVPIAVLKQNTTKAVSVCINHFKTKACGGVEAYRHSFLTSVI